MIANTQKGSYIDMANKKASEHTSYEVRRRWDMENLKTYSCRLRLNEDADLIAFIEANKAEVGTTQLFREALQLLIDNKSRIGK